MGLAGSVDSSVYRGITDILQRHPVITTVTYEPDSISKQFLRAACDPARIVPTTGPEPPRIDIEWRFHNDESAYRIHYADPNTGFNCGWHQDGDHPELGAVHFQYKQPAMDRPIHESASFEKTVPTEICWTALDRLFETRLPELRAD